jgi:hypothetical protein
MRCRLAGWDESAADADDHDLARRWTLQESKEKTANDLNAAVPKFCLAMEKDRRSPEGRIRSDKEFRQHFFPYDEHSATDRILRLLPNTVRGPVVAAWGIRGQKAALRDDDSRILAVVHDAFTATDIDDSAFEEGLLPDIVIGWVDLAEWWSFWRGGRQTKHSIQRALESGYELGLFDARWFLDTVEARSGKLRGTEVLADGLNKLELTEWIKKIHESGDGSPRGLLAALGWDSIVAKTANEVLMAAMDAMAAKNGLAGLAKGLEPLPAGALDSLPGIVAPSKGKGDGDSKPGMGIAAALAESIAGADKMEAEKPEETDWLDNPVNVRAPESDDLDVIVDTSAILGGNSSPAREGSSPELQHSDGSRKSPFSGTGGFRKGPPPPLPDPAPAPVTAGKSGKFGKG